MIAEQVGIPMRRLWFKFGYLFVFSLILVSTNVRLNVVDSLLGLVYQRYAGILLAHGSNFRRMQFLPTPASRTGIRVS